MRALRPEPCMPGPASPLPARSGSALGGLGLAGALAGAAVVETLTVNWYFHELYRISLHLKASTSRPALGRLRLRLRLRLHCPSTSAQSLCIFHGRPCCPCPTLRCSSSLILTSYTEPKTGPGPPL